jgi:hypothetical protein
MCAKFEVRRADSNEQTHRNNIAEKGAHPILGVNRRRPRGPLRCAMNFLYLAGSIAAAGLPPPDAKANITLTMTIICLMIMMVVTTSSMTTEMISQISYPRSQIFPNAGIIALLAYVVATSTRR